MPSLRTIPADSPDALALVGAMVDHVVAVYGEERPGGPTATPEELSPPGGCFVALYDDDGSTVLAGGGIKRLDDATGELKRMYVVPEAQGRGLSRVLLAGLEDAARQLGYRRLRLDTGDRQQAARHLYATAGYSEVPAYNENPYASYWAEKDL